MIVAAGSVMTVTVGSVIVAALVWRGGIGGRSPIATCVEGGGGGFAARILAAFSLWASYSLTGDLGGTGH